MHKLEPLALIFSVAVALSGCAHQDSLENAGTDPTDTTLTSTLSASFFQDWTVQPVDDNWYVSNHNFPTGHWASDFRRDNVIALPTGLNIKMSTKPAAPGEWPSAGGEVQSSRRTGFGEYHVIMKAAPGSGLVSAFFTYTGQYYNDPHDEIDFEFVGKSPYEAQLNVFTNGVQMGAEKYPVDFDTTKHYALYSFTWRPDRITWSINGQVAYEITEDQFPIPQTPGLMIGNVFQARDHRWVGHPDYEDGATVIYRCMSYRTLDDTMTQTCADKFENDEY